MTTNTKTAVKTAKTAAKPSAAVKSTKTAKGHTLAAVKYGKLVKIAECVREEATAAKPKPEAVNAKPKPPEASKPSEPPKATVEDVVRAELAKFREFERKTLTPYRETIRKFGKSPKSREELLKVRDAERRSAQSRWEYLHKSPAAVFAAVLEDNFKDEACALVDLNLNYHDDRGDGLLHVPAMKASRYLRAWQDACRAVGISLPRVRAA